MIDELDKLNSLLTVIIPVKNEEVNLPECLENLRSLHNVIIVDSDSKDRTAEIAKSYKREVIQFVWNGMFPKKRNWVLRNYSFTTPWVMFLDADERITEKWIEETVSVLIKHSESSVDAFVCYYDNWFMGRMLKYGDVMHKTAILRVGHGEYERIEEDNWSNLDMEIHEHLVVKGRIDEIRARLEHHDKRSLENYYAKHEEYANWEANRYKALNGDFSKLTDRQKTKYNLIKKWWFGFAYFCACYFLKRGFLDGKAGYEFARGKWRYFRKIRRKILG